MPSTRRYPIKLTVRVTAAERSRLRAEAARHGRSLSRYLVEHGLLGSPAMGPEQRRAHERAMVQLRKVGVYLNQIAELLNAGRGVDATGLAEALAAVERAAALVHRVRQP
jgi:hypothetical protein